MKKADTTTCLESMTSGETSPPPRAGGSNPGSGGVLAGLDDAIDRMVIGKHGEACQFALAMLGGMAQIAAIVLVLTGLSYLSGHLP